MAKYRKKPVEIEAFKWLGDCNLDDKPQWFVDAVKNGIVFWATDTIQYIGNIEPTTTVHDDIMYISTLEGTHQANVGDYIIRGVKGELYPCKPDIFEITYDEVVEIYTEGNI